MPRGKPVPLPPPIRGYRSDLAEWRMPLDAIAEGTNVVIRDGRLVPRSGFRTLEASGFGERVMGGIFYVNQSGTRFTVAGGITKRKQFTSGAWADITGPAWSGVTTEQARFITFQKGTTVYSIGVNDKDATVHWNGSAGTDSALSGAPIARDLTVVANRVLYGNPTIGGSRYPFSVIYSAFNDHEQTPSVNLLTVAHGFGEVMAVRAMSAEAAAIYLEKAQFILTAQGGSAPFRSDFRSGMPGPVSPAAVVPAEESHYYIGIDFNAYRFDGSRAVPIGDAVKTAIGQSLSANYRRQTHGLYDRVNREIHWFWVPVGSTQQTAGITYSLKDQTWSPIHSYNRDLSASWEWDEQSALAWTGLSGTWTALGLTYPTWISMGGTQNPSQLLGQAGGQTYILGGQGTDAGDAFEIMWRYPRQAPDGRKVRVDAIESFFKRLGSSMDIDVLLGFSDGPADTTITYQAAQTFDLSTTPTPEAEYQNAEGRYATIKFRSTDPNTGLEYHGGLAYIYDRGVAA
jgi:hypothetical protein